MTSKKPRGLGKGLEALLSNEQLDDVHLSLANTSAQDETLRHLPLDRIVPGQYQPRRDIAPEALQDLAASIRSQGVVQPIVVRPLPDDKYELIAGERRWRASHIAGLTEIPAVIRVLSDEAALAVALIENIQREELNAIEQAMSLQRLSEEFKLTHQQLSDLVGKSRVAITNLLRLLNLQSEVKRLLENHDIEMGHARALLSLDKNTQLHAAKQIVAKSLSVRQTEALVQQLLKPGSQQDNIVRPDPDISRLERQLGETLAAKVSIRHKKSGKGQLVISYNSLDELEGILGHVK